MENAQTIAQWQQLLQHLAPVNGWLYIGAGRGGVLREARFAKVPRLLAVEASLHAYQLLAHATAPHRNWRAIRALVNNTDGAATWHSLSREEESGLLPADTLSALWPNLNEQQRTEQPAVSLSQLLAQADEEQEHYNWLTIDCLPAARLLQGLNGNLQTLDMVEVRVIVNDTAPHQTGATLDECDALLLPQGFTRLALQEANNPLMGRALYARNFTQQLAEARTTNSDLQSQNNALTAQCNELKASHARLQKEQQDTRSELDKLKGTELKTQEKLQQAQQDVAELENQNSTLAAQCDELNAKHEAIQNERESLRNELESQKKSELQTKEALQQAQADLKEQQRSAQLSTKLLAKVEADASDLRERYAKKTKSEQELKDLIKELHAKLQAASHFYHKLEQEHPELLDKL